MTRLEHRCRLLLRAYPAEYRKNRGEEIIDTLLDATPAGRSWPLTRDVRSLVMGGLRARAALNRRLTTATSLRIAALVGVTAYLAYIAVNNLHIAVLVLTAPAPHLLQVHKLHQALRLIQAHQVRHAEWQLMIGVPTLAAVAVAWVTSRKIVVVCAAMAAIGALALPYNQPTDVSLPVANMVCLTALALLACGKQRPSRRWLWPVVLVAMWPLAAEYLAPGFWVLQFPALAAPMGLLSLLWVVVDARPAVATGVFALAFWLQPGIVNVWAGPEIPAAAPLLIVSALVPFAVWRLHRQSGASAAPDGARR